MRYKDLVYKITSGNTPANKPVEIMTKKPSVSVNPAKKAVENTDVLIGLMVENSTVLNAGISKALKVDIERKLTVLFSSPISDTFAFLPYDKFTLMASVDLFPEINQHYLISKETPEELTEIRELKKEKMNFIMNQKSYNHKKDFIDKIDYLVTVNIDELEPSMYAKLKEKNVMIFPLTFRGTETFAMKEKPVAVDPSGWGYNSASGKWSKNWGKDGKAEIPGWEAPDDWNLNPSPNPATGK